MGHLFRTKKELTLNLKFPYKWYLKDGYPSKGIEKNNYKVFSTFACGGGSTMGYKLAGFDVIGANEIDPKMAECYKINHNPKYLYIEPIQEFKLRKDLPKELYDLDILDGSPPCSSFSIAGKREKDWGKEKKFREGQSKQVLDTLFFDFIDLAKELQPKIVIAENVKGLLLGNAQRYVVKIFKELDKAGYYVEKWLLNASVMGVPQRRERVFFIALRKDLANKIKGKRLNFFSPLPYINLKFDEKLIPFKEIEEKEVKIGISYMPPLVSKWWPLLNVGESFDKVHPKKQLYGYFKLNPNKVLKTIDAHCNGAGPYHYKVMRTLTKLELCKSGTYPLDYNFLDNQVKYLVGMSVPPIMMSQISNRIKEYWLNKIS